MGDAFLAQLALKGVLADDVGEQGEDKRGAVVGLDLTDADAGPKRLASLSSEPPP